MSPRRLLDCWQWNRQHTLQSIKRVRHEGKPEARNVYVPTYSFVATQPDETEEVASGELREAIVRGLYNRIRLAGIQQSLAVK
jgi:hypothetical protein